MAMTNLRSEELFCDAIVRRGGDPWGYSVCREWLLDGNGSAGEVSLDHGLYDFATPLLSTKRPFLPMAAIDMLIEGAAATACLVSNRRELRDFIASGFPVAGDGFVLLVGYDDSRLLSTNGWIEGDDIFSTKLIAFSSEPSWTTRL
jgi:hypothetical protein